MSKPPANTSARRDKALYPAQQQPPMAVPVSQDERMARALQVQYDREASGAMYQGPPVVAQPGFQSMEMPFNCGHCGMPHLVRHAMQNTAFQCTRCGRQNQIVFQNSRPVVIVRRASWVPIPIFCNIQ